MTTPKEKRAKLMRDQGYVSVTVAASWILGSTSHMYGLISQNKVKATKVASQVFVSWGSVVEYINREDEAKVSNKKPTKTASQKLGLPTRAPIGPRVL